MRNSMKLILGTMTFGPQVDAPNSKSMVQRFLEAGHKEIDTAYVYNEGQTEKILGSTLKEIPGDSLYIATKVNPRITGRLDGEAVKMQLEESLCRLGRNSVDLLYLHMPDTETPVEDSLQACADLYNRGKFNKLGLSNFPAWLVDDIWHMCQKRGWPKPTVYQGMYNGLCRRVEKELLPALRKLGIRFYAFNPLAGGLLSGRYSNFKEEPAPGRFTFRPNYRERYWKKSYFDALSVLTTECQETETAIADAAFRWLAFHSCLDPSAGDGIIIGASKMDHLEQNLSAVNRGPLPGNIVKYFNAAWELVKQDCPDYYRFYSK